MNRMFVLGASLVLFAAGSCEKNSVTEPPPAESSLPVHRLNDLPADTASIGAFTYFSLRDSSIVARSDSNTTKWDLAFASTRIRTSSGTSGPGMGGAIVLTSTDFDTLSEAPASGYAYDTTATQTAIRTGSDNGWYHYDFGTNIVTPIPGRVLVIRTADGKYAKIQIISYYKGAPQAPMQTDLSRYYTFKYVYQPNGSRRLR